jgi:hypothetical protein
MPLNVYENRNNANFFSVSQLEELMLKNNFEK